SFLNPVFGMVLAVLVLGERVGPVRWVAAGIALLGAFILLRPGPSSFDPAALLALAAAAVMGVEITLIKILSGREPPVQILLMANIVGTILAGVTASFVWHWPTGGQWVLMVALGLTMVCAQALFIQAMRAAEASFVLPFSYATLVFAAVYDAVVFGARPDAVSALGAAVILAGAGVLAWRETRAARHA
ncbi:MAG: DMT family transporter, partial [Pseudomonadota bacterium]